MAIDLNTFRIKVRKTAGAPAVCEIDDDCIDAKVEEAIKKLSRLNPLRVAEQVSFLTNNPNADFPTDCFGIDHQYEVTEGTGFISGGTGFSGTGARNLAGHGLQHIGAAGSFQSLIPALTDVRMLQHVEEMSQETFPSVEFFERGGMIHIDPPPDKDEPLYVPLLKFHTLASFPASLEDQLCDLAAGLVYYIRSAKYKFIEFSAAGGRQKIKFGKIREFYKEEGDRLVGSVADDYSITLSALH